MDRSEADTIRQAARQDRLLVADDLGVPDPAMARSAAFGGFAGSCTACTWASSTRPAC